MAAQIKNTKNNTKIFTKEEKNLTSNTPLKKTTVFKTKKKRSATWQEIGHVVSVGDGVAKIIGLTHLQSGEFVTFVTEKKDQSVTGIALNLENKYVSVAIFGNERLVGQGTQVKRGLRLVSVPTGEMLLGRVIDALGNVIDGRGALKISQKKLFCYWSQSTWNY